MPELDITRDILEHDPELANLYLTGVMVHPDDAAARDSVLRRIVGHGYSLGVEKAASSGEAYQFTESDLVFIRMLREAPDLAAIERGASDSVFMKSQGEHLHRGAIAGYLLLIPWTLVSNGLSVDVGLGKARRALSQWQSLRITNGKRRDVNCQGFSERNLDAVWEKFGPVSHLWASQMILTREDRENPVRFLAMAETLRAFGKSYRPKGSKAALLADVRTWDLSAGVLTEWDHAFEVPVLADLELLYGAGGLDLRQRLDELTN